MKPARESRPLFHELKVTPLGALRVAPRSVVPARYYLAALIPPFGWLLSSNGVRLFQLVLP